MTLWRSLAVGAVLVVMRGVGDRPARRRRWLTRRRTQRLFPWLGGGVLLLALSLRLPFLGARALWFDEAFSWRLSAVPWEEFFSRAAADVHPILYYLVLRAWMSVQPVSGPEATLLWMRLLSVVFGVVTVGAMMHAGQVLFRSRWAGLTAGALTAVSAFQVQYAWEARMYTLGTALLALALAALVRTVRAGSARRAWRGALVLALSLGALLHVHYYALFSWAALGFGKLLFFFGRMLPVPSERRARSTLGGWQRVRTVLRAQNFRAAEGGFWLSAVLFLPWVPVFLLQAQRVGAVYWIPRLQPWSVPNTMARLFWGGAADVPHWAAVLASLAALAVILVALLRGRTFGDVLAVCAFAVPLALAVLVSLLPRSVYLDRYFLFASLGLVLLVARVLTLLPLRAFRVASSLALLLGVFSVVRFWMDLDFPSHQGARAAAAFLRERAAVGEPVLVSSPFAYFPVAFHLGCMPNGGACQGGRGVRLHADQGSFLHFAGAPILTQRDLGGTEIFRPPVSDTSPPRLRRAGRPPKIWAIDTTGFGGSDLPVPAPYRLVREDRFPEPFAFQGDIIVREYENREPDDGSP